MATATLQRAHETAPLKPAEQGSVSSFSSPPLTRGRQPAATDTEEEQTIHDLCSFDTDLELQLALPDAVLTEEPYVPCPIHSTLTSTFSSLEIFPNMPNEPNGSATGTLVDQT